VIGKKVRETMLDRIYRWFLVDNTYSIEGYDFEAAFVDLSPYHDSYTDEQNPEIRVILGNALPANDLKQLLKSTQPGVDVRIWYVRDGITAHVPMLRAERARKDKAFKMYNLREVNAMLSLRKTELIGLEYQKKPELVYVSPDSSDFAVLRMDSVVSDYSHIDSDDSRARWTGESQARVKYKIPSVVKTGKGTVANDRYDLLFPVEPYVETSEPFDNLRDWFGAE